MLALPDFSAVVEPDRLRCRPGDGADRCGLAAVAGDRGEHEQSR